MATRCPKAGGAERGPEGRSTCSAGLCCCLGCNTRSEHPDCVLCLPADVRPQMICCVSSKSRTGWSSAPVLDSCPGGGNSMQEAGRDLFRCLWLSRNCSKAGPRQLGSQQDSSAVAHTCPSCHSSLCCGLMREGCRGGVQHRRAMARTWSQEVLQRAEKQKETGT